MGKRRFELRDVRKRLACKLSQGHACGRGRQAPRMALEQPLTDQRLNFTQGAGQGGLADPKPLRGAGQTSVPDQGVNDFEVTIFQKPAERARHMPDLSQRTPSLLLPRIKRDGQGLRVIGLSLDTQGEQRSAFEGSRGCARVSDLQPEVGPMLWLDHAAKRKAPL